MTDSFDFLKRVNIVTHYDSQFPTMLAKARGLLQKCPPEKFLDKWPKLADEDFRKNLSDNDAVVTLVLAISVVGNKEVPLYWCDDWELLYENMILNNIKKE